MPTVTGVFPNSGPKAGGTSVTITGSGLALGKTATVFKFGATKSKSRIEAAQRGQAAPEQVVDEVATAAPELQEIVRQLLGAGWKAAQILLMLLGIVTFIQSQTKPTATKSDLKQATEAVIKTIERQPIMPAQQTTQRALAPTRPATERKPRPSTTYGRDKKSKRR